MKDASQKVIVVATALIIAATFATKATADQSIASNKYTVDDRRSGYTFATKETNAIQNDDMQNPAIFRVDDGEALFKKKDGKANTACITCHGKGFDMKGVATRYPVYDENLGKMKNIEQQINKCRVDYQQAKPWKYESNELLAMTIYVRHQSRGMPMNVSIDGKTVPFFKKGKAFYYKRLGALDMACKHCHEDNPGKRARANLLSQGQINGFPTYRFKWQKVGSTHRRFRGCNKNIRAKPQKYGSDDYVNLELYISWRGRGLPVETPAVRN